MSVVSDTSPLNYLVLIDLQDLLPELFDRVLIPDAVHREPQAAGAPDPVKRFFASAPAWLDIRSSPDIDPHLRCLDAGERAVITLRCRSDAIPCCSMNAKDGRPRATGAPSVRNPRRASSRCKPGLGHVE